MTTGPPPKRPERRQRTNPRTATGNETALAVLPGRDTPAPPAPAGVRLKAARDAWEAFWRSPVSQAVDRDADGPALRRWIEALHERERIIKVVRKTPLVKGSTGQPVLNPLAKLLADLENTIRKAEEQFGMTPMSRLRLGIAMGEANRSLADLLADVEGAELEAADVDDDYDPRQDATLRPAVIRGELA